MADKPLRMRILRCPRKSFGRPQLGISSKLQTAEPSRFYDLAREVHMLLTEIQAAEILQIDRRTLRNLLRSGRLRGIDVGGGKRHCFRIDPADLRLISGPEVQTPMQPRLAPASRRRPPSPSASVSSYLPNA